jgi:WXG100 protein secretion system (Wss), protein YukD
MMNGEARPMGGGPRDVSLDLKTTRGCPARRFDRETSAETGMVCSCIPSIVRASYTCLDDAGRNPFTHAATSMNMLTIEVWDATGNKKQLVELPSDAPVNRVIAVLVEKMSLPRYSPDGQLMSYKFHHKASGRQLLDDQTLASADVHSGDVLRLQPEITAGRATRPRRDGA